MIPTQWATERLYIAGAVPKDLSDLQDILEKCHYIAGWEGRLGESTAGVMERMLCDGDLPPGGRWENYFLQTVRSKASDQPIAWLDLYFGYPTAETVWWGTLEVHPHWQRRGYGGEIEAGVVANLDRDRYHQIRVKVALKNWPAIRFWWRRGYDWIVGYHGDRVFDESCYAFLVLEKCLSG